MKKENAFNILVATSITLGIIALSIFAFPSALKTVIESVVTFGYEVCQYFISLLNLKIELSPPVINLPSLPSVKPPNLALPSDIETLKIKFNIFLKLLVNKYTFLEYWYKYSVILVMILNISLISLPIVILMIKLLKKYYFEVENNNYDKNSKFLKVFLKLSNITYRPIKRCVKSFIDFLKQYKFIAITWLVIMLYNLNIISISLLALGAYFNFSHTLDFKKIFMSIIEIVKHIIPTIKIIPVPVWLIACAIFLGYYRKKLGYNKLNSYEKKNEEFVAQLPICVLNVGTMGTGKTTFSVDLALTACVKFRKDALKIMNEIDFSFPHFPWPTFGESIKQAIKDGKATQLYRISLWVKALQAEFEKNKTIDNIFGYEYEKYGLYFDNGLENRYIFNELSDYAQAYFIYFIQSSLIISNIGIREDFERSDNGNLPIWNFDFFDRTADDVDDKSRYSHIIDFDMLRLGERMCSDPKAVSLFEFGVVNITELAKERGNQFDHAGLKKADDFANQKNDLFDKELKLIRHSATVRNRPFVLFIADDQRAMSLGADLRELHSVITITEKPDFKRCLPFFLIEEALNAFVFSKFADIYVKYRHIRGDNTLFMYLLKSTSTKFLNYYKRTYNIFSRSEVKLRSELGTMDGAKTMLKYYLMPKKVYARRFATDCYKEFLAEKILAAPVGIADIPEFKSIYPTVPNFRSEHSYFIEDLVRIGGFDAAKNEKKEQRTDK